MTSKVGPKGQVVVPKRVRDEVGLRPGDEVVVESEKSEVRIRRVARPTRLLGMLSDSSHDLLAELESEHRWEVERDEALTRDSLAGEDGPAVEVAMTMQEYRRIAYVAQFELDGDGPRAPISGPMVRDIHRVITAAGRRPVELDAPDYAHGTEGARPHPDVALLVNQAVHAGELRPNTFYGRKVARMIRALVVAERAR